MIGMHLICSYEFLSMVISCRLLDEKFQLRSVTFVAFTVTDLDQE